MGGLAGEPGFEPRQTESESVVLPLHHFPMGLLSKFNMLVNFSAAAREEANRKHPDRVLLIHRGFGDHLPSEHSLPIRFSSLYFFRFRVVL